MHVHTKTHTNLPPFRSNEFPFVDDGALQYKLKCAAKKKNARGVYTQLRLHENEINAVKHYEERFANGPDLHKRNHERIMTSAQINSRGRR